MLLWFTILLPFFIFFLNLDILNCYGDSPSYSRLDIEDSKKDWREMRNQPLDGIDIDSLNDIRSMNYISDGKTISVTFWLEKPFEENPITYAPIYTLYIDADAEPSTGGTIGVDYRAKIVWNSDTQRWEKIIEEVSAHEKSKILSRDDNFSNFYPENDESYMENIDKKWYPDPCCFIKFDIDLNLLNYPPHYLIYSSVIYPVLSNDESLYPVDSTNYVMIPTPQIQIVSKENPVTLRKDETKLIPIQINSTSFREIQLNLSTVSDKYEPRRYLSASINPSINIPLPPNGSFNAFLEVTSKQFDVTSLRDQIPINGDGIIDFGKGQYIPVYNQIYQLVELKNYPFSEWLNDKLKELGILWKDNTEFMLLIIGIFLTPIGAWIVDKATKRKRKNA